MNNTTISKAEKLANSLIDKQLQEIHQEKKILDPMLHLRNTTAEFINKRFEKIQKDSELELIVVEALKLKIKEGNVNFNELTNFLNQMRLRSTDSVDSLLNFFKPAQGESSPLLSDTSKSDESIENKIFKDASSQDLQVLQKLVQMLESNKENS